MKTYNELVEIQVYEQLMILTAEGELAQGNQSQCAYNDLINRIRVSENRLKLVEQALVSSQ